MKALSIRQPWVLADVRTLKKPIPCKGMLGLWSVRPEDLKTMKRQLPKRYFTAA